MAKRRADLSPLTAATRHSKIFGEEFCLLDRLLEITQGGRRSDDDDVPCKKDRQCLLHEALGYPNCGLVPMKVDKRWIEHVRYAACAAVAADL